MVQGNGRLCAWMEKPFLDGLSKQAQREREETAKQVYEYYQSVKAAQPYLENNVPSDKLPPIKERPEILNWLVQIERWGLPDPGTWMDQPMLFLAQVEGAMNGKKRALDEAAATSTDWAFDNAPKMAAVVTR